MKTLLAMAVSAAALTAAVSPAHAVLDLSLAMFNAGSLVTCANGDACDLSSNPNVLNMGLTTVGNFTIADTAGFRQFGPNELSLGQVTITNTSTTTQTLLLAVSADGFLGHTGGFNESATAILNRGVASASFGFFADSANILGGRLSGTDTPGVLLTSASDSLPLFPHSFSFNDTTPMSILGPYSMSEAISLTLSPGASIGVSGAAMDAVPEPSTWAMTLLGFGGILLASGVYKRKRLPTVSFG